MLSANSKVAAIVSIVSLQNILLSFCQRSYEVNWTAAAPMELKTTWYPPQFVPYAPCACDLTTSVCDYGCCCDADCAPSTVDLLFECDAASEPTTDRHANCDAIPQPLRRLELFGLLCVESSLTPHLGYFYEQPSHNDHRVGNVASRRLHDRTVEHLTSSSYKYDSAIATSVGFLSLPSSVLGTDCSWLSPIRFLVDDESVCRRVITNDTCYGDPVLNLTSYIAQDPPPSSLIDIRERSPRILSESQKTDTVPVTVRYLCRTKELQQTVKEILLNESYTFANTLPIVPAEEMLEDCALQPGKTIPALPRKSDKTSVCENVVSEVQYSFLWNHSSIEKLDVKVVLENVKFSSNEFAQKFSVLWRHQYTADFLEEDRQESVVGTVPRSGNPGYIIGRPVIGAYADTSSSVGTDVLLSMDDDKQLFGWATGPDNLCAFASKRRVNFGVNTTSGCMIQLALTSFVDCDALRELMFWGLDALFTANRISRNGTVPSLVADNFVEVLTQYPFWKDELENLKDKNKNHQGSENDTTVSMTTTTQQTNGGNQFQNSLCRFIPIHVAVDIFYAETQLVHGYPVFEIVGAYKYYNFTTMRYASIDETERFFVGSTVRFYQKPPNEPDPPPNKYSQKEGRFHCPSYVTCFDELFFPFTIANRGTNYADAIAVLCIIAFCSFTFLLFLWRCLFY